MDNSPSANEILQYTEPLSILGLPPVDSDILKAIVEIQKLRNDSTVKIEDIREAKVLLVNGHHFGSSVLPTVADEDLTFLSQAATAVGYSVWGDEQRYKNPLIAHQELVESKHNGDSHLFAYIGLIHQRIQLGGVVTLVQGRNSEDKEFDHTQPPISIGFNELLVLPLEIIEELIDLPATQVGELTLFTILDQFRDISVKKTIAQELLKAAIIRAKELGITHLYAIMPDFVSRLLPKESYQVVATTYAGHPGDTIHHLPLIRKLKQDEIGFENARKVYLGYPKYWQPHTLQLCRFNLDE